jgi:hypothetical protein
VKARSSPRTPKTFGCHLPVSDTSILPPRRRNQLPGSNALGKEARIKKKVQTEASETGSYSGPK